MHKNLGSFVFKGGSPFVDEIPTCNFDVRVGDCNQSPLMICNLGVHLCKFVLGELLCIKLKVLVVLGVQDVHPINVDWEAVGFKVLVSFGHYVG